MEPPNELGYIAAMLELGGIECRIRDYPMVDASIKTFIKDLRDFDPQILILATTAFTFDADLLLCKEAKQYNPEILTIVKAPYLTPDEAQSLAGRFNALDIILLEEYEYTIKELAEHFTQKQYWRSIKGMVLKHSGDILYTGKRDFIEDLDRLPFPARHLFDNKLYARPDTGEMRATIQTARGCSFSCIFCLASKVEGRKVRARSPENIVLEIKECIDKFGIKSFFLRADTFTLDKDWVISLAKLIIKERLDINWVCNSRVNTLDNERLYWMKKAGCWLISLGIESGNQGILDKMRKGITLEDSKKAVSLCRRYGIKSYCFFVLGMPWEDKKTILETINFARELKGDFYLFHIVVPFPGTELYSIIEKNNLFKDGSLFGYSHFHSPVKTFYLSPKELRSLWKKANWAIYSNPGYILRTLQNIRTYRDLVNYSKYGYGKMKELIFK